MKEHMKKGKPLGMALLNEMSMTVLQKRRAKNDCKWKPPLEKEPCKKYVSMIRESKEAFITYKGIFITRKLLSLIPGKPPACTSLVKAYISMDQLPAFDGYCKNVLPDHAAHCQKRVDKLTSWT